jgi:triacylglycerol lipase
MARILAVRRPDLVDRIVTLGAPLVDQFAVHPFVRLQVRAVATVGTLGLQGVFSHHCRDGCCAQANADLAAPFPEDVQFTSIYSTSDGIVDWRACLDPGARHVKVRSTHVGMSMNSAVFTVVAEMLAPPPPADQSGLVAAEAA